MLIYEWHQFYHICWLLWRQLNSKKSLLVTGKIPGVFFNILSASQKYYLLNRENLTEAPANWDAIASKTKNFFLQFWHVVEILNIFKKRCASELMYFASYRLRNSCLDKCLKSPVSEDTSKSNMGNRTKHCLNLNNSTLTIFIDLCQRNWVGKSLC